MVKISPHFIGIGAAHAGLSLVAAFLEEHPAIADTVAAHNFFNTTAYDTKGLAGYRAALTAAGPGLVGDCSPGYLTDARVPERIVAAFPDAKLFVVVRHPLARALADYDRRRGIDAKASRTAAVPYLLQHPEVQSYGFYAEHLQPFFAYYSPLQLSVIFYEDLVEDPLGTMQRLYEFLEVDKNFVPRQLRGFAPPPEDPKHPGLIKRLFLRIGKLRRRLTVPPAQTPFGRDATLRALVSPADWDRFSAVYVRDATHLSHLLSRDMVAYWALRPEVASETFGE